MRESQISEIVQASDGLYSVHAFVKVDDDSGDKQLRIFHGFDCILCAIGRTPRVQDLQLQDHTDVALDPKTGHIVVDAFENTSVSGMSPCECMNI